MPILFRDYESRSAFNLKAVGAWKYSVDPTTDVWCCAYAVDDGPVKLWLPGDPIPPEWIEAANNPGWLVSAFNDQFERLIEQHIVAPRYGWPLVPIERHRCTQAASLAHALPSTLEGVAKALNLAQQKDMAGHKVMMELAKPRKPQKGEDPSSIYWCEYKPQLGAYCQQDVETERAAYHRVGHLSGEEQALWLLDAKINDYGAYLDGDLLAAAGKITDQARAEIAVEISEITGGEVTSISQPKLKDWLAAHGCIVTDLQKETLRRARTRKGLSDEVRRVLELRRDGAHVDKLDSMRNWRGIDGRARGAPKFHGASTGRWTSYGIQLQNMKRPTVDDMNAAIDAVSTGSLAHIRQHYSDPLSTVGDIARAIPCAAPGHRFIAADFSGIESRVTAWVSGQQSKLDQWAKFDLTQAPGDEPYLIQGRKCKVPEGKARDIGKTCDLAFGFMGSVGAWQRLAPDDDSTDEQIIQRRNMWRRSHPKTVAFWYALDRAAIKAVRNPSEIVPCARVSFQCEGDYLFMTLPSGRRLAYPFPRVEKTEGGKKHEPRSVIVFMDWQKGKWQEYRSPSGSLGAYGGLWIENAVQAISRDLFAAAMPRLEAAGYRITLHVHDEIIAEVPDGFGSEEEFKALLLTLPPWATDLPLNAKTRNGPRFCKTKTTTEAPPIQPEVNILEDAEVAAGSGERTSAAPTGSPDEHNLVDDDIDHGRDDDDGHDGADDRLPWSTPTVVELMGVKPWDIDPVNYPPPPPPRDDPPPRGNGGAGNGHDHHDSYPHGEQERGRQTNAFVYQAADGKPYLQVRKFEWTDGEGKRKKAFPQYHRENGRWIKGKPAGPRIPYRLPALLAAAPDAWIDIMEGEKDADRGAELLGLTATTNPEGAEKWHEELNEYFRGRRVRLHEDNDAAGRAHVAKTASMLRDIAKEITVVSYPEQKPGGDFSDFMDTGGTLKAMAARARPYNQEAPKTIPIDLWAKFDPPKLPRGVLPKVIEQFAFEQGDLMGADPAGLAMAALAVCGAAIPDQIELQVKEHDPSWREAARLWIALVADPSSKKSPILRQAARPLNRIDAELARKYAQEIAAYFQLSADERKTTEPPKKRRMRIEDTTIEAAQHILKDSPDGVLSLQDELSGWFGAMEKYTHSGRGAGKDRGFWLQSWNGGAYVCDRIGRGTVYIPNLSVSLLGGIQPVAMRKIIDDTVDDGLIQRVIPVMLRPATVSRDEARPDAVATYETTVAWLAGELDIGARLPALIQFSPEAHVIRRKLEQRHLDLMTCESFNAKLAAHLGKYDGYFARLCLTWHCLETSDSAVISEEIALRVEKFLHGFLLPHAVAFYTSMKGEDQDRLADVAGYILAHTLETVTNRDLARCIRSTKGLTAFEVKEVFDALDALGWLTPIPGPRPSSPTRWDVNPECHHRFAARAKAERVRRGKVREIMREIFTEPKEE